MPYFSLKEQSPEKSTVFVFVFSQGHTKSRANPPYSIALSRAKISQRLYSINLLVQNIYSVQSAAEREEQI